MMWRDRKSPPLADAWWEPHGQSRFITLEELAEALARYGVSVEEQVGVGFNPFLSRFRITAHLGGSAPGSIPPPAGTGRPGGRR